VRDQSNLGANPLSTCGRFAQLQRKSGGSSYKLAWTSSADPASTVAVLITPVFPYMSSLTT
jgi:hypothetical protein